MSRKRSRDVTTTTADADAIRMSYAEGLSRQPSAASEATTSRNSASLARRHDSLALRSRTLRSRVRQTGELFEDVEIDAQAGRALPHRSSVSGGIGQAADASRPGLMFEEQRSDVTGSKADAVSGLGSFNDKVSAEHTGHATSRRRLGLTGRTARPATAAKGRDNLPVSSDQMQFSRSPSRSNASDEVIASSGDRSVPGLGSRSNTEHELGAAFSSGSRSSMVDDSFTKLVAGLRRIPPRRRVSGETVDTRAETLGITRRHRVSSKSSGTLGITRSHQVNSKNAAAEASTPGISVGIQRSYRLRQNSVPQNQPRGRRRRRLDRESSCGQVDEERNEEKGGCDREVQVKDCVVALERSRSIENMVKGFKTCPVSETRTINHSLPLASASSSSSLFCSFSETQMSSYSLTTASTLSSSSSAAASSLVRNREHRHKLSLRKSARTEVTSSSHQKNSSSDVVESVPSETTPHRGHSVARNLSLVGRQKLRSSETPGFGDAKDSRCVVSLLPLSELSKSASLSGDISATATRRLKRRKVCLQLTGSSDVGSGFDTEEVMDGSSGTQVSTDLTSSTVVEQNRVILPQPDPDLLPSPSALKRAKTSEPDLGESEVILQPDPDSWHSVETGDDAVDGDGTSESQAKFVSQPDPNLPSSVSAMADRKSEVIPRPDPDLSSPTPAIYVSSVDDQSVRSQSEVTALSDPNRRHPDPYCLFPIGQADFTADRCTDAMYHMALFSDPEASDPGSSPPLPSSPSETLPGGNQTSTGRQMAFYDDDDEEKEELDEEADDSLSDAKHELPKVIEPRANFLHQLKQDFVPQTCGCSADVFSATSAEKVIISTSQSELPDEDYVGEPQLFADESEDTLGRDAAQNLSRFPGDWTVGNKGVDLGEISTRKMNRDDKSSSQSEKDVNFDVIRCETKDISSTALGEEFMTMPDRVEHASKPEGVRSDLIGHNNGVEENFDISLTPGGRLSYEERSTLVKASDATDTRSSGDGRSSLAGTSKTVGIRKNSVGSTANDESHFGVSVGSSAADVMILRLENSPPSRHRVVSDLSSSCRRTLLQSAYDAFCSDAADLPPRPRCVLMRRIYALTHFGPDLQNFAGCTKM